jgi:hypothetical protein
MIKKQKNKKKIYSKKRVLRGGFNTNALIYQDGLHSLLTGYQHNFGDKEKLLTKDVCLQWFSNIKTHDSYNAVIKNGLVKKGSDRAKEAVRLCQEFHPELTLERESSYDEFDKFITIIISSNPSLNTEELREVLFQIKRKFVELKLLVIDIAAAAAAAAAAADIDDYNDDDESVDVVDAHAAKRSSNPIYNTDDAIIELRRAFITYTRDLFNSESITSSPDSISLKDLKKLFGKLVFKIISQPTPEKQGFFIEVEKHSFLGLHSSSHVNCESLKLFDVFVNKIMEFINTTEILMQSDDSSTSTSSESTSKRLFLVLTSVGESYKKRMKDCGIEKPSMEYGIFTSMRELGLPYIEHAKLRDNCSKTRRRHRHKLVRKTRRKRGGRRTRSYAKRRCASKSHKRRR